MSRCCQRHLVVTAEHGGSTIQRRQAIEQLIVCRQVNSITAAYFDAPFAQGESQGAEKWQRPPVFLLREVFKTAKACKMSVRRDDFNLFISGDYFSCVQKTFCAQRRHAVKLLHPVGNTDVRAIFWSSLDMTACFRPRGNTQFRWYFVRKVST